MTMVKNNMCIVLMSLHQWGVVAGTVHAPTPADVNNLTPAKTKTVDTWDVCATLDVVQISLWVAHSAKNILGDIPDPKVAWDTFAKRFGAK
jgi:hypothetical protein